MLPDPFTTANAAHGRISDFIYYYDKPGTSMAGFKSKKPGAGCSMDCTFEKISCACDVTSRKYYRA
jgi:hypothetical protein